MGASPRASPRGSALGTEDLETENLRTLGHAKCERIKQFVQLHEDHAERARRPSEQIDKKNFNLPDGAAPVKSRVLIHEAEVARARRPSTSFWRSDVAENAGGNRNASAEGSEPREGVLRFQKVATSRAPSKELSGAADGEPAGRDTDDPLWRMPAATPRCAPNTTVPRSQARVRWRTPFWEVLAEDEAP